MTVAGGVVQGCGARGGQRGGAGAVGELAMPRYPWGTARPVHDGARQPHAAAFHACNFTTERNSSGPGSRPQPPPLLLPPLHPPVQPCTSGRSMAAPRAQSSTTTSSRPMAAATWRGVRPRWSLASSCTPRARHSRATTCMREENGGRCGLLPAAVWGAAAAHCSGVQLASVCVFLSFYITCVRPATQQMEGILARGFYAEPTSVCSPGRPGCLPPLAALGTPAVRHPAIQEHSRAHRCAPAARPQTLRCAAAWRRPYCAH